MSNNWLFEQVRRTSRNRIIFAGLIAIAAVGLVVYNATYLRNAYKGPATVQPSALAMAKSPESLARPWVRVRVDALKDTGVQEISIRKKNGVERSRSVTARYFVAPIDNRLLVVKVRGSDEPSNDLKGEVIDLEPGMASSLFKGASAAQLQGMVLPLELDTHDYSSEASMLWWIVGLSLVGAAGYALIAWTRRQSPASHPAMKRAAKWAGLDEVALNVKREQAQAQKVAGWSLSDHYLLSNGTLNFDLHNMDDLLWAHALVTKKKVYYVIPAGQTHALVLKWGNASVKIDAKEAVVKAALQHIAENQPWVALGWSQDMEKLFNQRGGGFGSQIAKARRQWLQDHPQAKAQEPEYLPTQPIALST